jgi:phosphoglycolate phosphatase
VYVFFDLDGTLTDPREGIVRCLKYALQELGTPSPTDTELTRYIGPPLHASFAALLNSTDAVLIARAVALYRQRFAAKGLYENILYPGIAHALRALQARGAVLYVVTAKPTVFAAQILTHLGLSNFFRNVYGSELDGTRADKKELIAHVLAEEGVTARRAIMVGDREQDIQGAVQNGVRPVGVLWGYGSRQELLRAGASVLCAEPATLPAVVSANQIDNTGSEADPLALGEGGLSRRPAERRNL